MSAPRYAAVNGLQMYYEVHGDPTNPPMLLIHGHGAQLIAWHTDLLAQLVELGYAPAFGARPLKRAILRRVQDPLAEEILAGGYPPGATV